MAVCTLCGFLRFWRTPAVGPGRLRTGARQEPAPDRRTSEHRPGAADGNHGGQGRAQLACHPAHAVAGRLVDRSPGKQAPPIPAVLRLEPVCSSPPAGFPVRADNVDFPYAMRMGSISAKLIAAPVRSCNVVGHGDS